MQEKMGKKGMLVIQFLCDAFLISGKFDFRFRGH